MVSRGTIITILILGIFTLSFSIYAYSSFNVKTVEDSEHLEEVYFINSEYNDYTNKALNYAAPSSQEEVGLVLIYEEPIEEVKLNLVDLQNSNELINTKLKVQEEVEKENYVIKKVGSDYIVLFEPFEASNIENLNLQHTVEENKIQIKSKSNIGNRIYLWRGPFVETGARYDPKFNLFWF